MANMTSHEHSFVKQLVADGKLDKHSLESIEQQLEEERPLTALELDREIKHVLNLRESDEEVALEAERSLYRLFLEKLRNGRVPDVTGSCCQLINMLVRTKPMPEEC